MSHMEEMGLSRTAYDHVVTSGEATHRDLAKIAAGSQCWLIGTPMMGEVFDGYDVTLVDGPEGADFIMNSIPGVHKIGRDEFMEQLERAAKARLPMICANPDLAVNIGAEQYECAGTFAALYEKMGGAVTYHAKPHAPVYEWCHELLGAPNTVSYTHLTLPTTPYV